jgi:hypothetical protein
MYMLMGRFGPECNRFHHHQQVRLYFGGSHAVTLQNLFNWNAVEAKWDDFWVQGTANYTEEMTFYELLSRTKNNGTAEPTEEDTGVIVIDE